MYGRARPSFKESRTQHIAYKKYHESKKSHKNTRRLKVLSQEPENEMNKGPPAFYFMARFQQFFIVSCSFFLIQLVLMRFNCAFIATEHDARVPRPLGQVPHGRGGDRERVQADPRLHAAPAGRELRRRRGARDTGSLSNELQMES